VRNFFNTLLGKKNPEFFEVIKGRKSVKYFDTDVKIKREEIIEMLDEANIAPSSCNLQPWRYIVVDTPEGKEKLGSANYNKIQNDTSAAMIIVLGDLNYYNKFDEIYGEAVEKGYMTGISENKFAPMMSTSRAMISQIIYNLENTPKTTSKHNFTDVPQNAWYEQSLNFTFDKDIVAGFPDKTFRGNSIITREQLSAILYRYARYKGYDMDTDADMSKYEDFKDLSDDQKSTAIKGAIDSYKQTYINRFNLSSDADWASILEVVNKNLQQARDAFEANFQAWVSNVKTPYVYDYSFRPFGGGQYFSR